MMNMEMPGRRKREGIEEGHAECHVDVTEEDASDRVRTRQMIRYSES